MRKRLGLLLFFFWIFSGFRLLAQTSPIAFTRFTTQHGLSSNVITSLAKDRRGFLWIGTINGLNRFDGLTFKVFKSTGAASGLPSNYVNLNGLTTDSQGYLWISTTRGLLRF
ncbi:ligand-binding sensor domain-containing protein, partial [Siphonobacter sp.]|uniref:ligand-binding sensor domain-containing protein n=1 Tax=Siphonobacter sp. TaxID=1869184 RepID=UPI003B3BBBC1